MRKTLPKSMFSMKWMISKEKLTKGENLDFLTPNIPPSITISASASASSAILRCNILITQTLYKIMTLMLDKCRPKYLHLYCCLHPVNWSVMIGYWFLCNLHLFLWYLILNSTEIYNMSFNVIHVIFIKCNIEQFRI